MYNSKEETDTRDSSISRDCEINAVQQKGNVRTVAKKKNNLNILENLLVKFSEIEELTPLHISVIEGFSDVAKYLINHGADVNRPDKILQFTPLHLAIYQHRYDLFQLLLDKGADVDGSGRDNLTPLHLSAMLGCPQFAEALINHGAKVNFRYDDRLTPLHLATIKSHLVDNEEVTGADAIRFGNEKSLIVKLITYPYDPISQDYEAVIRLLFRNGADVDALTSSGWSSLHYALKNKDKPLVEVLVDAGADVNSLTKDGKSPLHLALEYNFTEVLRLLVESGAELNCKESRCLYTLWYITARNNDEDLINEIRNLQKSPLLQAINSLANAEMKKAVMCLCAIVDASNESSCMPVSSEIQSDHSDSSRSLRINRVNVHDPEVYSKFACDQVLSGALRELGYDRAEKRKPQYAYDYLSMLNAVRLPLVVENRITSSSRTQSIADMYSHNKLKTHYESCLEEVEKMKGYVVDDNRLTLYDVLHMRPKRRWCYTKNLNLCEIQSEFEIYYKLIFARYREDVAKRALMDTVQLALFRLARVELPIICVEEIFADLGVMNMIATIEAAEMVD